MRTDGRALVPPMRPSLVRITDRRAFHRRASNALRAGLALLLALLGCTRSDNLASSRLLDSDAGEPFDAAVTNDAASTFSLDEAGVVYCGNAPCACSNGRDDDGDGLIDGFDPECTGPFDQYEDSFATGVHGENQEPKCQDCFFDGNSGSGDDGCNRPSACAQGGQPSGGACKSCEVSAACEAHCAPLAPNGCDCFGCCGVWRNGAQIYVLLRDTCSLATLDDAQRCPRCQPASDCLNPCSDCELCPGRTAADLPVSCRAAGGPGYDCDGFQLCGSGLPCAAGLYCQQGCCMEIGI